MRLGTSPEWKQDHGGVARFLWVRHGRPQSSAFLLFQKSSIGFLSFKVVQGKNRNSSHANLQKCAAVRQFDSLTEERCTKRDNLPYNQRTLEDKEGSHDLQHIYNDARFVIPTSKIGKHLFLSAGSCLKVAEWFFTGQTWNHICFWTFTKTYGLRMISMC